MPDDPDPEERAIHHLTAGQSLPAGVVGPGDDGAVLADGTVLVADTMVQGVHWDDRSTPEQVGRKLIAVNASDIAACGARPTWTLLTLSLPTVDDHWLTRFSAGLRSALIDVPLLGGDTTRTDGPIVASLTMAGVVDAGAPLLRSGARAGEDIWVTGQLGRAADAFHGDGPLAPLVDPTPPLALGPMLAARGLASAAMDLSDGLAADLPRLCRASGVGAVITTVPTETSLERAVGFGDDYELLFVAPTAHRAAIQALPFRLTRIGRTTEGDQVVLPVKSSGWRHF